MKAQGMLIKRNGDGETFIAICHEGPGDSSAHIRAIRIPTLILWGADDVIIPERYAEDFDGDIPGSRVILHEGIGHVLNEALPEKAIFDVPSFLREGASND
jgi:pimeloyl-ACP methyl ester carboxylesterase